MSINWEGDGNVGAGNFSPIPAQRYLLKVVEAKEGKTAKGKDKMELVYEVAYGEYEGRKIWETVTFTPKGEPGHGFTVQAMKALGLWQEGPLSVSAEDFIGRQCEADVEIQTYEKVENGATVTKQTNKVKSAGYVTEKEPVSAGAAPATVARAAAPAPVAATAGRKAAPRF